MRGNTAGSGFQGLKSLFFAADLTLFSAPLYIDGKNSLRLRAPDALGSQNFSLSLWCRPFLKLRPASPLPSASSSCTPSQTGVAIFSLGFSVLHGFGCRP